jgi:anti-anti-sigma factor
MLALALGWEMEVERGPGCLLVRLGIPGPEIEDVPPLADVLWSLMQRHLVSRIVLDLSEVKSLDRHLLSQLVWLYRRIRQCDGMMRLTGLSSQAQALVRIHGLNNQLPMYDNLEEAMMGHAPCKPR